MMINEQMPTASSDNVTLKAGKVCGPVSHNNDATFPFR